MNKTYEGNAKLKLRADAGSVPTEILNDVDAALAEYNANMAGIGEKAGISYLVSMPERNFVIEVGVIMINVAVSLKVGGGVGLLYLLKKLLDKHIEVKKEQEKQEIRRRTEIVIAEAKAALEKQSAEEKATMERKTAEEKAQIAQETAQKIGETLVRAYIVRHLLEKGHNVV